MQGDVPDGPMEVGCESFRGGGKARIHTYWEGIRSHICILDSCRCMQLINIFSRSPGGGGGEGGGLVALEIARFLVTERDGKRQKKTADMRH